MCAAADPAGAVRSHTAEFRGWIFRCRDDDEGLFPTALPRPTRLVPLGAPPAGVAALSLPLGLAPSEVGPVGSRSVGGSHYGTSGWDAGLPGHVSGGGGGRLGAGIGGLGFDGNPLAIPPELALVPPGVGVAQPGDRVQASQLTQSQLLSQSQALSASRTLWSESSASLRPAPRRFEGSAAVHVGGAGAVGGVSLHSPVKVGRGLEVAVPLPAPQPLPLPLPHRDSPTGLPAVGAGVGGDGGPAKSVPRAMVVWDAVAEPGPAQSFGAFVGSPPRHSSPARKGKARPAPNVGIAL
jgi:hypothetical protein